MNSLFFSLPPMEFVMMIMGVIIFLALVFLLIWQVMKQRPYVLLLAGFLIPIILVGYPTIQSIGFDNWKVTVTKYSQQVANNPKDTVASRQLKQELTKFQGSERVQKNPEALATVANAQLALGRLDSASITVQKAAQLAPQSVSVKATQKAVNRQIEIKDKFLKDVSLLNQHVNKLQEHPKDTAAISGVISTLSDLQTPRYVNAASALIIAKSYATINQRQKSLQVIDNVLKTDTGNAEAKQLNTEINTGTSRIPTAKLTPAQNSTIQRELRFSPVVGDRAVIRVN